MAITSQVRGSGAFGEVIVQDWQAARLLKPSAIKPVFATLEQALVIKTLGKLSQRDQQMLKEAMTRIVG
jgi:mRNA interferase MazF